jgi:HAMP domain-containing protein
VTPGQTVELTYYQGSQLYRKTVQMSEAGGRSLVAEGGLLDGLRNGGLLGDREGERPALRALGRVIDGLVRPADESAAVAPATEIGQLRAQINQMRTEIKHLKRRVEELETRLDARR